MIEVLSHKFVREKALSELIKSCQTDDLDILILDMPQNKIEDFFKTPTDKQIILIGAHHPNAALEIQTPFSPHYFIEQVTRFIRQQTQTVQFENDHFSFNAVMRQLIDKKNNNTIRLTEKETALIAYLYQHKNRLVPKEELLRSVWNYRQDTETHTVETHIYALRQKIGTAADAFLTSSVDGYQLK